MQPALVCSAAYTHQAPLLSRLGHEPVGCLLITDVCLDTLAPGVFLCVLGETMQGSCLGVSLQPLWAFNQ